MMHHVTQKEGVKICNSVAVSKGAHERSCKEGNLKRVLHLVHPRFPTVVHLTSPKAQGVKVHGSETCVAPCTPPVPYGCTSHQSKSKYKQVVN